MMEAPEAIRQSIQHYQHLLTLHSSTSSREQVLKALAQAEAQLAHTPEAEPANVAAYPGSQQSRG